jgi:hypothetical protein
VKKEAVHIYTKNLSYAQYDDNAQENISEGQKIIKSENVTQY